MDQEASLDFPIPNEIIEIVTTYLSAEDLLVLAAVATERLKKCAYRVLRKKLKGKYKFMGMYNFILSYRNQRSTNISISFNF